MTGRFRSLRFKLLLPLTAVSLLAAVAVAIGSYWQGDRWARQQIESRFQAISDALSGASYPLNQQVIDSLADLTDVELLAVRKNGSIANQSIDMNFVAVANAIQEIAATTQSIADDPLSLGKQQYRYGAFLRGGPGASSDDVDRVIVLFDESKLRSARLRAAALPLVTGLSTVFLLSAVALSLAQRLIQRLRRLSVQVDRIAEGQFASDLDVGANDEIGTLGTGVRQMSSQLQQMWDSLQRRQGEKLLHQIAGGLAHQLRNSLTGARMAVELHSQKCPSGEDESLQVALSQLEQTEDAVRRLLLVAAGKDDEDRPGNVASAIEAVRGTLAATAKHLHVDVVWEIDAAMDDAQISDAPSLSAALSNLVLNAIQTGRQVTISAKRLNTKSSQLTVSDDGPGPPEELHETLFDPFVTSRQEGLGLGLPLVKRAAQRLRGSVTWRRENGRTVFELIVATHYS